MHSSKYISQEKNGKFFIEIEYRRIRSDDAAKCYKKLYFDPEADSSKGSHYYITDGELREKLKELVDDSEKVTEVRVYTHLLTNLQVTKDIWHHAFVVFLTYKWWWSIEKKPTPASQFNDQSISNTFVIDTEEINERLAYSVESH